jgi:hypothetical protein
MSTRSRFLLTCGSAALTLALAPPSDPVQAAGGHEITLARSRVAMLERGRIVASFDATGDIKGMLTVTIDRGVGAALGGEWVLVSRYLRDLTPEGEPDEQAVERRAALPGEELHRLHKEYIEIRERGTLRGSISGGALVFDVDGRLTGIEGLQLAIQGGSIEFKGAAGSGTLTASGLRDQSGTGSLTLASRAASSQEVK